MTAITTAELQEMMRTCGGKHTPGAILSSGALDGHNVAIKLPESPGVSVTYGTGNINDGAITVQRPAPSQRGLKTASMRGVVEHCMGDNKRRFRGAAHMIFLNHYDCSLAALSLDLKVR